MQESLYLNFDEDIARPLVGFFLGGKAVSYKKGEIITRSDNPNYYVYCSKSGYVMSYSISPKGHRDIHTFTGPTTMFPSVGFLISEAAEDHLPSRTVYFEALTDVTVWRITEQAFRDFVLHNTDAQLALLKHASLNHRVHITRVLMMQIRDVRLRLICFLLILALTIGESKDGSAEIGLSLSHQVIADSVTVARETVSRELHKLQDEGLIKYRNGCICLPDVQRLKEMVEDY